MEFLEKLPENRQWTHVVGISVPALKMPLRMGLKLTLNRIGWIRAPWRKNWEYYTELLPVSVYH